MTGIMRYFIRRLVQSFFILWLISLIIFTIIHLAPGGPVSVYEDARISPETVMRINQSLGLNDPIIVQYARWMGNLLRGDFGRSFIDERPVIEVIFDRIPATIELNIFARIIGLLGIPLGIYSANKRGKLVDNLLRIITALASAAPHWWIGLMVLIFIAAPTGIFPLGGMATIGKSRDLIDHLWHLILPATISAIGDWLIWCRYLRASILDVISSDYIRTAYAKGLPKNIVYSRHAFRNALIPVITIFGGAIAGIVSGSVAIESTFSWPGIGRLAFTSAIQRDYPTVMALLIISVILVMFGSLVADIAYTWADPRIKLN
jgi:peptide/nickel transport system permease protein